MRSHFIDITDGYKLGHAPMLVKGLQRLNRNWTPRGSRIPTMQQAVHFGYQFYLQAHLMECAGDTFFSVPRGKICDRYQRQLDGYFGPDSAKIVGTQHISDLHDLGYLPLEFYAVPEGTLVPMRTPMSTCENTHDEFAWLNNYLETAESSYMFLPCTTATQAHFFREELDRWCEETGGDPDRTQWQAHDFSGRGIAMPEAASISGAAHLLSFTGSDSFAAIGLLEDYYDAPTDGSYLIAGSVLATEHSIVQSRGKENEVQHIKDMLALVKSGMVANVSDTWNYFKNLTEYLAEPEVHDEIMRRNGTYIVRPDSGDPVNIICGDRNAAVDSPEWFGTLDILAKNFGWTKNAKGYIVLDPHIGVIYGDGMSNEVTTAMLTRMRDQGWCSQDVFFGVGSFRYQHVTRDTFGFAVKATDAIINDEEVFLEKDPITDYVDGVSIKKSACGRVAVNEDGSLTDHLTRETWAKTPNKMIPIWRNGEFVTRTNFQQIRATLGHHFA